MSKQRDIENWLSVQESAERSARKAIVRFFREQRSRIREALDDHSIVASVRPSQLLDTSSEHDQFMTVVEPIIAESLARGAARVLAQRPKRSKAFRDVDLSDYALPGFMKLSIEAAFNHITQQEYWSGIQFGTQKMITDVLTEATEKGMSYSAFKKELMSKHKDLSEVRAAAIARTEVSGSINQGHQLAYKTLEASGETLKKEWGAVLDTSTRPAHAEADGQIVGVNEDFLVGGERCDAPAAANLSPGNRINCRCTTFAVFEDDEAQQQGSDATQQPAAPTQAAEAMAAV